MLRRLLFIGALAYAAVMLSRVRTHRATAKQKDQDAKANWDSEGGTPPPDPVDTPVTV
jgi:hypothetical protein